MRNWIIFECVKYEALTLFKVKRNIDSEFEKYIRICVDFKDLDKLKIMANDKYSSKDVSYTLKFDDIYHIGYFDIKNISGISGYNNGVILDLELKKLEIEKSPIDWIRNFHINELLN